ncbi:DUF4442 domain-containing protein [Corynebacterium sp. TAE3-ERU12]|uniref:DUF4442 domain-containing protein n=1 Tax=Corynebacterium sp. TAE3-ERU12 TaxID=2849491 RepID=UPI001C466EFF|nr:DUF4442 domain-containing protein [Corynebacterium sp. TAE3-ERU12]MBV7295888.1 DUF4442 domain-containing protein [Corynebacterium sp. TAE3-ERU12]
MRMTPARLRRYMWLWPPYLGAGVRVTECAEDGSRLVVQHRQRPWNTNALGIIFGGTMQSMTDPFYTLLGLIRLGHDYVVVDSAAEIEFLARGRGTVTAVIEFTDADLADIKANTAAGQAYRKWFSTEITDESGTVIARVRRQLYVRLKPKARPQNPQEPGPQGSSQ